MKLKFVKYDRNWLRIIGNSTNNDLGSIMRCSSFNYKWGVVMKNASTKKELSKRRAKIYAQQCYTKESEL